MSNPIYIVGSNPLAHYLGYHLQTNGHDVILLLDRISSPTIPTAINVSINDERTLSQQQCSLNVSLSMEKAAEMVIITSYANRLNTSLAALSIQKINNAPVICFTPLKDISYLYSIVSQNTYQAFFNGYISSRKGALSLDGRKPEIVLCASSNKKDSQHIINILNSAKLHVSNSENHLSSFWQYIIPYAIGSIWSASEDCKISTLLSDKTNNQLLRTLIDEFCSLAANEQVKISPDAVMKNIYNIPANYIYPLHKSITSGGKTEFDLLTSIITKTAVSQEINIPQTYKLLNKLYNLVLSPTL